MITRHYITKKLKDKNAEEQRIVLCPSKVRDDHVTQVRQKETRESNVQELEVVTSSPLLTMSPTQSGFAQVSCVECLHQVFIICEVVEWFPHGFRYQEAFL